MKNETQEERVCSTAWRETIRDITKKLEDTPNNLQNIHTPYDLCSGIIGKLKEQGEFENKDFCTFNLEFIEVLRYNYSVPLEKIWFVTDCKEKAAIARSSRYKGTNVVVGDVLKWESNMKFDVVIFNPPYQSPKKKEHEGRGKCGSSLWEEFVVKSIEITKDNGFVCAIHPPRWRKPDSKIGKKIKSYQLLYLEMHGLEDGKKTFNCQTDFDWYILQKSKCTEETIIVDQNKETINLQICDAPFIPDTKIKEVMALVAKEGEEKVNLLWDCYYHTQAREKDGTMQKDKSEKFPNPCIYSISINNEVKFRYASNKGQFFGIPKVVYCNGHTGLYVDENGEFGLTQFACGITDSLENLPNIAKALKSERFVRDIMGYRSQGGNAYEKKIISLLRKDFWKEFV